MSNTRVKRKLMASRTLRLRLLPPSLAIRDGVFLLHTLHREQHAIPSQIDVLDVIFKRGVRHRQGTVLEWFDDVFGVIDGVVLVVALRSAVVVRGTLALQVLDIGGRSGGNAGCGVEDAGLLRD